MSTTWTPALATGVLTVDEQHKELFRQAARLKEAMVKGEGRAELAKILGFLKGYVVKHFQEEERVMAERDCPAAEENKRAHAALLRQLKDFERRFEAAGANSTLVLDLHDTLCSWLVSHIQGVDCQLQAHPVLT